MSLEVCMIDTEMGLLYEWNGSLTVNVYYLSMYVHALDNDKYWSNAYADMWTLGGIPDGEATVHDFIESVEEHVKGDG